MTSGTGIECINLKKAKYIRDMKASQAAVVRKAPEASVARTSAVQKNTATVKKNAPSKAVGSTRTYNDGYTAGDIIGILLGEASRAFVASRKKAARERAYAPHYVTKKVKAKAFPISTLGYIVVFSVIAMFLVLGNSKINEANLYAESLESQINENINQNELLTSRLNMRNDAAMIEDYAINTLGLVRKTDVAKKYVSISGEDKVVVSGTDNAGTPAGGSVTMTLSSGR